MKIWNMLSHQRNPFVHIYADTECKYQHPDLIRVAMLLAGAQWKAAIQKMNKISEIKENGWKI